MLPSTLIAHGARLALPAAAAAAAAAPLVPAVLVSLLAYVITTREIDLHIR